MSRTQARIHVSCWHDDDFLDLTMGEQHAYFLLLSQHNVNYAGVLATQWQAWARLSHGMTPEELKKAVAGLEASRFVVVDDDVGELWIRTFVKHDGIMRSPNLVVSMSRDFGFIRSPKIREAFLEELGQGFLKGLPEGLAQRLAEPFRQGLRERFRKGSAKGSTPAHVTRVHGEPPPPPPPPSPPKPPPGGAKTNASLKTTSEADTRQPDDGEPVAVGKAAAVKATMPPKPEPPGRHGRNGTVPATASEEASP